MTSKSSRRDFLRVSGGLVAGAAVAGCVAPVAPSAAGTEGSAAPTSERVALRFLNKWGSGVRRELMNGFLDNWAEQRPEIGIIFEPVADFDRRMPILVAAGEWGDIMLFFDLQLSAFHEIAANLTAYFEASGTPFPGEEGSELIRIPNHVGYEPGKVKVVPLPAQCRHDGHQQGPLQRGRRPHALGTRPQRRQMVGLERLPRGRLRHQRPERRHLWIQLASVTPSPPMASAGKSPISV